MSFSDADSRIAAQEAQLIAEIAGGSIAEPMRKLCRRYGRNLYRFGVHMLGDDGLAEEMVQIPLRTVKTQTFQGMQALRSALGGRGFVAD